MKRLITYFFATAAILTASAQSYSTSSVLSTGRWVKIAVAETGMHQITPQQLAAMGFSDPSRVTVWGMGATMCECPGLNAAHLADDLVQTPVYRTSDGRVLFYGNGRVRPALLTASSAQLIRNAYSDKGYYFVTDSRQPLADDAPYVADGTAPETTAYRISWTDPEKYNISSAGTDFYGDDFSATKTLPMSLPVPGLHNPDSVMMTVGAVIGADVNQRTRMVFTPSNAQDSLAAFSAPYMWSGIASDYRYYKAANNAWTIKSKDLAKTVLEGNIGMDASGTAKYMALEYAWLVYPADYSIDAAGATSLYTLDGPRTTLQFTGALADAQVWDVTYPTSITPLPVGDYDAATGTVKANVRANAGQQTIVAFNPGMAMPEVEVIGDVANQNLHGLGTPQMLIITTDALRPAAEELAAIHNARGMVTEVVTQKDVFNEFSSGAPHVMAYRRIASMLDAREPGKMAHILLYGAGVWDNRAVTAPHTTEQLLTYQIEDPAYQGSSVYTTAYDLYFGIMNPSLTTVNNVPMVKPSLSVGRIPVNNLSEAHAVNRKIQRYLSQPMTPLQSSRALLMSDQGDSHAHLTQAEDQAKEILKAAPYATVIKANDLLYPVKGSDNVRARNVAISALQQGVRYMSYCGHGTNTALGTNNMWSINAIANNSYLTSPVVLLSSCNSLVYDHTDAGLGVRMCLKEDGGSIAMVGTTRSVILTYNAYVSKEMAKQVFSSSAGRTIGDAYLSMRNAILDARPARDVQYNTMNYNLCGDPSLPIYASSETVQVLTVKGQDANTTPITVEAFEPFTVTGTVNTHSGQVAADFNGEATLEIYDGPYNVATRSDGTSTPAEDVSVDEAVLAQVTVPVTNGQYTANFTLPMAQHPNVGNRLLITAISTDKTRRAAGAYNGLMMTAQVADTAGLQASNGPSIEAYIDSSDFVNGQVVGTSFHYHADITTDGAGLNLTNKTVGSALSLTLDGGSTTYPTALGAVRSNADGTYSLDFDLTGLSVGRHTISLSVADNLARRATHTLSFVVDEAVLNPTLTLVTEQPARQEAVFELDAADASEVRLIIQNHLGQVVRLVDSATMPYTWDMNDNDGNRVADGTYTARVIITTSSRAKGHSEPIEFVVLAPTPAPSNN